MDAMGRPRLTGRRVLLVVLLVVLCLTGRVLLSAWVTR